MIENQPTETSSSTCPSTVHPTIGDNLSKRQQRKLETYLRRKEERREFRKLQKQRKKARLLLEQSDSSNITNQVTETPEQDRNSESKSQPRQLLSRKALAHVPRMSDSSCQTQVVIDCAYDHLMSFKDICKLANQISKCYAANRRLVNPVQLHVTGLGKSSDCNPNETDQNSGPKIRVIDRLKLTDCDKWDINLHDADYTKIFPSNRIVYLCAESKYVLPNKFESSNTDQFDENQFFADDVYVIGGLVDHNSRVGYCYEQAQIRGHRTAKLPLDEANVVMEGRHVLSTVHVFEALAPVLAGVQTWPESLRSAIPARKLR